MGRFTALIAVIVLSLLFETTAFSADIKGTVTDAQTGEPLPAANVLLVGTTIGSATDINGKYNIRNAPAGTYTIRASYIGYQQAEAEIQIQEGSTVVQNFELTPVGVEEETVVITAQASGQLEAINKQLSSSQIINAVSAAWIQELPDANAAESVSRLPGVSVLRSGGEGFAVVVRGLAPKFNAITINGVRMSSSDANDRGTNLSMISSNSLAAIQVSKTVTPDMDANVIGGAVNFELRGAAVEAGELPSFSLVSKGSYNGLPSIHESFRNYEFVGTAEDRFLDNRLGVFVQGSYERRNLSSDELNAAYTAEGASQTNYLIQSIAIDQIARDRERINGVLSLDYTLPEGKINFANFFSTSTTELLDRQQFYNVDRGNNTQSFIGIYGETTLNSITNILSLDKQIPIFNMEATLSHSYSETKNPNGWNVTFTSTPAGIGQFGFASNLDPQVVVEAALNDTSNTLLQTVSTNYTFTRQRALTASLDFSAPLNITDDITTVIKFGGKFQYQTRSFDNNVFDGQSFGFSSGGAIINQLENGLPWFRTKPGDALNVLMSPFINRDYDYQEFLGGDYELVYPLNFDRMGEMVNFMKANPLPNNITFNYDKGLSIGNDYHGKEEISAAYIMATINLGSMLTIIPGVRYQQLKTVYTAHQGLRAAPPFADYPNRLATVTQYHPFWLPDVSLRFKPLDWFDLRLSYTNTLSYPNYSSLAPIIIVALNSGTLQWNGFNLKPIKSVNYDAYLSFYNNEIGLLTVGAFLKQITDLIYQYTFTPPVVSQLAEFFPEWVENPPVRAGIAVSEFVNNPYQIDDYGIEVAWQTHFWYLPGVLSGLVLNVNYTHIFSKAEYPYQLVIPGRPTRFIDTSYFAPLLYQPDDIINLSIGYDYEGFSIRVSSIYSSKIFTGPSPRPQLKTYTDAYTRWDIAAKQKLPFEGLEVFCNLNNINGTNDVSVISAPTGVPSLKQSYGYTIDLGLRYEF